MNKNNTKVIQWMRRSIDILRREHDFDEQNIKIFFATDSPQMARILQAQDNRVVIFDQKEKEENEGHGFIMPGWQGWGRSPGTSAEYKSSRCEEETVRAFLDMVMLCKFNFIFNLVPVCNMSDIMCF